MDPALATSQDDAATSDSLAAQHSSLLPAVGDQTVWSDATTFLMAACDGLEVGELVHGENFSLFEAMSALEIMDPKMDAGMATAGYKTVEEAIEKGAAPTLLTIPQVIDIMDHLLACEATWHKGHSLAQTVFSCLYMLKLDLTAQNALLHAYCKVTRATCSLVRTVVALSDIHEEEEFVTFGFGFPLEGEGDNSKCLATLNAVEEELSRQLRGSKGQGVLKKELFEALEEGFCEALLCRLRFRKALYHTLVYMDKPLGRGSEMAQKHIVKALAELSAMKASSEFLSSQCQLNVQARAPSTASGQAAVGFDESVNGRLLAPTPPRSIDILSWVEMVRYFEQLLNDLHRICSLSASDLELEELFQYIVDFQKCHPDLVARAFLRLLVLQDGKLLGRDSVTNSVYRAIKLPSPAPSQASEVQNFLGQTGRLTLQLIKIMCTNSAWQRRKLGRVILEWGNILEQAESVREHSIQRSLTGGQAEKTDDVVMGWGAEQLCWIVAHFLLLGFELELYSLNEYCMVYWYLDHALLTLLHYKLATERRKVDLELLKSKDTSDSAKKKGRKKKGGVSKSSAKEIHFTPGMLLLQCYSALCKGFFWMLAALIADRKIICRETIFNSELERFMQRFELLQRIVVPEPLTYLDYREAMHHKHRSIKELYRLAYDHFMAAEQHVQELNQAVSKTPKMEPVSRARRALDVQQLDQVVQRNRIALQVAHQAGPGDNLKVSFEFSQHSCFAVAILRKP